MSTAKCRACPALVQFARMPSGKNNPLNITEVEPEVGKGVVAFNPARRTGVPVTVANIDQVENWREKGVSFHVSHFADCPARRRFRKAS